MKSRDSSAEGSEVGEPEWPSPSSGPDSDRAESNTLESSQTSLRRSRSVTQKGEWFPDRVSRSFLALLLLLAASAATRRRWRSRLGLWGWRVLCFCATVCRRRIVHNNLLGHCFVVSCVVQNSSPPSKSLRTFSLLRQCRHLPPNPAQPSNQPSDICALLRLELQRHAGLRVVSLHFERGPGDSRRFLFCCCLPIFCCV
jgi:hypothetical protein